MVTKVAPTRDHVAIWYSILGRGVGPGVVVTGNERGVHVNKNQAGSLWYITHIKNILYTAQALTL